MVESPHRPRFRFVAWLGLLLSGIASAHAAAAPTNYPGLRFHGAPKALASGAVTEEWPHFLGPHFNATTAETPLLAQWPQGGPRIVWECESGEGYACPTIASGRLVYFHHVNGEEIVDCLDPETGRRHWRFAYAIEYQDRYGYSPGPRSSAVINDGRVYVAGVTALLHCLDLETGRVLWRRDLANEFQVPQYFFGYGPTPLVWRDRVIVNVGGKAKEGVTGTCVAAFDKTSGKTLWEVEDSWGASYASPVVRELGGRQLVLVVAAGESRPSVGGLLTIDPESGRVFDRFAWRARAYESVNAATPVLVGNNRVLVSESYEKGAALLQFDGELKSKLLWTQRDFGLHWMMPLVSEGYLYGFAGRNPPDTELRCVNAETGAIMWSDDTRFEQDGRVNSFFRGCLLRAGDRIFCLGEDGLFAELRLSPKGMEIRQRVRLFEARSTWTLPAIHRGLLYVKQNERDVRGSIPARVICYDFRGE